jgi:hypothetical protein
MAPTQLFCSGNSTSSVRSGLPSVGVIYGVAESGDLLRYRCVEQGEKSRTGNTRLGPELRQPD